MSDFFNSESHNYKSLYNHLKNYFVGHTLTEFKLNEQPIINALPRFRVFEVGPGEKTELWTYVSAGAWEIDSDNGVIEFAIIAPTKNFVHVKLLAMTAFYHIDRNLGYGHTFPIGMEWLDNSDCDHFLVSLPYPYSPEFAVWDMKHHRHKHGHIFGYFQLQLQKKITLWKMVLKL